MEINREEKTLAQYWNFIEEFRGKKGLGMGDARAYLSALVDIEVLNSGMDKNGLIPILEKVLSEKSNKNPSQDYEKVIAAWVEAEKEDLIKYLKKIKPPKIKSEKKLKKNGFSSISLFSGSFGLDLGFEYAGFEVGVALDIEPASEEIISANRPKIPFILDDIVNVDTKTILETAGIDKGDLDVLTGGPPCQPFSTAGKREGLNDPRASPLTEYIRVINEAQPKVFVMEEVTGLLSARLSHVPIKERNNRKLLPEEEKGSVWKVITEELRKTGYKIRYETLNAADYGAPQNRKRVILIGVRPDIEIKIPLIPEPTHKKPNLSSLDQLHPWINLQNSIMGIEPGECPDLSPKFKKYMPCVPPGGNWRQIPDDLKKEAMNNAFYAGGGKMGFYRRLCWFEQSPTLVTSPTMKSTMMVHPWEDRPISVNEYKVIQGFPIEWLLPGSVSNKYKKVGEAVPPTLSFAIAKNVRKILESDEP